jgi:tRNA pseudouridine synthase 10
VVRRTRLCPRCLRRQGVNSKVTRTIAIDSKDCEICKGVLSDLPRVASDVALKLREYQFDTFLIGATVPQDVLDAEDEIRARLKIRGTEGIKTEITRTIARVVSKRTGRQVNFSLPDITVIVHLPGAMVSVLPRAIWLFTRYLKKLRGLPQRASACEVCNGIGCASCGYRGSSQVSIQSILSNFFSKKYEAETCNFIWVGSEDENSLVDGEGRPAYVEIVKPKRRKVRLPKNIDLDSVKLGSISVLSSRPTAIPQFTMQCIAYLLPKDQDEVKLTKEMIKEQIESRFKNCIVRVRLSRRKFRVVSKRIHSIKVHENKEKHPYALEITCDGGIPIKKLISGEDDSVQPNLSPYLGGFRLDPSMPFDIENIFLAESTKLPQNSKFGKTKVSLRESSADEIAEPNLDLESIAEEAAT